MRIIAQLSTCATTRYDNGLCGSLESKAIPKCTDIIHRDESKN